MPKFTFLFVFKSERNNTIMVRYNVRLLDHSYDQPHPKMSVNLQKKTKKYTKKSGSGLANICQKMSLFLIYLFGLFPVDKELTS